MKTVAIIQARTGSTRLPGKVMADIAGRPMLTRVVERVQLARGVDRIVIATTSLPGDTPLAEFCRLKKWAVYRGDSANVLSRYLNAARLAGATNVIRITSDCPLIDPGLIDVAVDSLKENPRFDYVSNVCARRTFPRGLDVEAFRLSSLVRADAMSKPEEREHVTQAIYRNPDRFSIGSIEHVENNSRFRWTVDTQEDLNLVRAIYSYFAGRKEFTTRDVIAAYKSNPQWLKMNQHIQQKVA